MIYVFLDNVGIVINPSFGQKTILVKMYNRMEISFNTIGYKLSNDFVLGIIQDNRSKILENGSIPTLWDEIEVGRVDCRIHCSSRKGLSVKLMKKEGKGGPITLVHKGV